MLSNLEKYLKWQLGCEGETEGNEEFIGRGDEYIAKKCKIKKETFLLEKDKRIKQLTVTDTNGKADGITSELSTVSSNIATVTAGF